MQIWSIWLYDQLWKKYPAINLKKMSDATLKYSCIVQLRQNIKGFSVIRVFKDNRVHKSKENSCKDNRVYDNSKENSCLFPTAAKVCTKTL